MKKRTYILALIVCVVLGVCGLSGCSLVNQVLEAAIAASVSSEEEETEAEEETASDREEEKESSLVGQAFRVLEMLLPGADKTDGETDESMDDVEELLAGYEELCDSVNEIMEDYESEDGSVSLEEAAEAAQEVYEYGCQMEAEGVIDRCIYDEEANSVTMVLQSGARVLFSPHVKDTYSGTYQVSTVNTVGFSETVPVSVVFNGNKTVSDYGEYTLEMMEECQEWSHLDEEEVTVEGVCEMLANVAQNHCRLIYWRGHGSLSDGKAVLMLGEKRNYRTSQRFSKDIRDGYLLFDTNGYYGITPEFVEEYMSETSEGGLFFCGSCHSAEDGGVMAKVFLNKGFQAYVGTNGSVKNVYSDNMMKITAEYLCEERFPSSGETMSIWEALIYAREKRGESDVCGTEFCLYERLEESEEISSRLDDDGDAVESTLWEGFSAMEHIRRTDRLSYMEMKRINATRTVPEFRLRSLDMENNGGSVVRYQGDDYYWRYRSESVQPDGIFAYYSHVEETENEMICRHSDGTEEVLFRAAGCGDIYISGGKLYLTTANGQMYSVNMDGSGRRDYGYFPIWDADAASGIVLGGGKVIRSGSTATGKLIPDGGGSYAGTVDGYVYFSDYDSDQGEIVLYRYGLDGESETEEVDRYAFLPEFGSEAIVLQVAGLGNSIYYSYGYYAGSGVFFQEGGINRVNLNEDGEPVSSEVCVAEITAEEFLVAEQDGAIRIYYIDQGYGSPVGFWDNYAYEGCRVKNMSTGQVELSSFPLSSRGSYVWLDGAVCMIHENEAAYTTVIPKDLVTGYGCADTVSGEEARIVLIRNLACVGDDVYYTVETSERDNSRDVGWRPGYRRIRSEVYRLTSGSETAELLYSY
ncbi:MAG: hypothetical protein LUE86_09415 [Clostridiales bacterium]|nr:hypothetical protein [Clostridiales bacterium]